MFPPSPNTASASSPIMFPLANSVATAMCRSVENTPNGSLNVSLHAAALLLSIAAARSDVDCVVRTVARYPSHVRPGV